MHARHMPCSMHACICVTAGGVKAPDSRLAGKTAGARSLLPGCFGSAEGEWRPLCTLLLCCHAPLAATAWCHAGWVRASCWQPGVIVVVHLSRSSVHSVQQVDMGAHHHEHTVLTATHSQLYTHMLHVLRWCVTLLAHAAGTTDLPVPPADGAGSSPPASPQTKTRPGWLRRLRRAFQ